MIPKFSIADTGMLKITEGLYNNTEFKFKDTQVKDNVLAFDIEFTHFFIDGVSYIADTPEDEFNTFVKDAASDILKQLLYAASKIN